MVPAYACWLRTVGFYPHTGGVAMIDGSAEPLADTRHLHRAPSKTLCGLDAARIQLLASARCDRSVSSSNTERSAAANSSAGSLVFEPSCR